MIDRSINGCVSFLVKRGVVADEEDQRDVYGYDLELLIYYVIHAAVLLAIGQLFVRAMEVGLILFLFGLIQGSGGGYHANTHGKCLALMICGALLFLVLLPLYRNNLPVQAVSVLSGLVTVICLAPIAHKNHPLSPRKSKAMGRKAKYLAGGISLLWCVVSLFAAWPTIQAVISITMAFCCVSMVSAWVKKNAIQK